ncbi:MAG: branched-chain amino acid ABC transporter permease [Smithellaceae bacterium]|nr:branched-chain amino acid ABC transporter permease [Syntrophaceae bacterium]MDD4239802.1 branched-chain amino acid ABC transporter permease [Smithellaceae bacterium]NLX52983.1 branched-chain amino acid ABC transporter permease [Deltaproteobacteria bacterium]
MGEVIIQLVINGLLLGGLYALLSIGLTLIFGVLEIVNFAHGEFLMISMYLAFLLFSFFGMDPYLSLIVILPVFFLFGYAIEKIIIKPLLNDPPLNQIFATIGLGLIFSNVALLLFKADFRTVKTPYSDVNLIFGNFFVSVPRLIAFLIAIALIAALLVYLKKTFTGKAIRALAQQRKAAMLMGIDVHRTYAIAFGIGIACVGAAGAVLLPLFFVFPTVGSLFSLIAFVIVILGGYNSLAGSLVAGLIIGLIEGFSGFFISPHLKEVVYFVLFIFILIFRPTGLFGKR